MAKYDKERVETEFTKGKRLLELGRYEQAIQIFTILIDHSKENLDQKEAEITYQTSLNNRGVAKCEWGWDRRNKEMFEDGLKDYEEAVNAAGEKDNSSLTAHLNLTFGRKQLEVFDQPRNSGFKVL